ncbi:MAG: hypothetical protein COA71_04700 [SAR86 cluster bacterium]|uniref:DUF2132 domain-containing protein n=1 Tax=SAR86 cluster bacterium TaxID=2030880 RepID=A0A2A5CGG7_9GAMM|nr:MAG: hypothetical protein COA71_04700 [SAR86 cluster bacterium]
MPDEINYFNNPLHGLSLKNLLVEIIDHYDFGILFAYLNINCFKTNPSIVSSVKFLKKTDWARERVEAFYLYEFKNLPRASTEQFELPPRERVVPDDQKPGEPAILSLEDAERLRAKRVLKAAARGNKSGHRSNQDKNYAEQRKIKPANSDRKTQKTYRDEASPSSSRSTEKDNDPWANSRKKVVRIN